MCMRLQEIFNNNVKNFRQSYFIRATYSPYGVNIQPECTYSTSHSFSEANHALMLRRKGTILARILSLSIISCDVSIFSVNTIQVNICTFILICIQSSKNIVMQVDTRWESNRLVESQQPFCENDSYTHRRWSNTVNLFMTVSYLKSSEWVDSIYQESFMWPYLF
jgi:hypothetical protein